MRLGTERGRTGREGNLNPAKGREKKNWHRGGGFKLTHTHHRDYHSTQRGKQEIGGGTFEERNGKGKRTKKAKQK